MAGGWEETLLPLPLLLLLLLLTAGILDVVVLAAPLGRADIGVAVATMAGHCWWAPGGEGC
jgi:hypothetical protein